jgi:hypothetical protein
MLARSILALLAALLVNQVASAQATSTTLKAPLKPQAADAKYLLQYKLRAGESLYSKVVHFAETRTKMSDHEESSSSRTTSEKVWEVKSVDAKGQMTFEYRILSVDLAQRVGEKDEIKYSSESDENAPDVFKKVAETVNTPLGLVTINPRGQVTSRDKDTKNPQLGMGELTIPLPAEPIAVGSEWSVPREMRVKLEDGSQKTIKVRELYTLEKVSAGVATIRIESQPLTPINDPAVESQLIQQLSKGQIKFDIDRGRMLSKQLDWDEEAIGFRGDNTSLKYDAKFTEELLTAVPKTASKKARSVLE